MKPSATPTSPPPQRKNNLQRKYPQAPGHKNKEKITKQPPVNMTVLKIPNDFYIAFRKLVFLRAPVNKIEYTKHLSSVAAAQHLLQPLWRFFIEWVMCAGSSCSEHHCGYGVPQANQAIQTDSVFVTLNNVWWIWPCYRSEVCGLSFEPQALEIK